tara:strand:+ start:398 stop:634 length:237 start_codon:yes stop_codon:yes gene_type:complete
MKVIKPSFLSMVKSIAKDTANWVKNGAKKVSKEEYIRRAEVCDSCVHFIHKSNTCGVCGCWMDVKAKWKTTKCPKDKW